MAADVDGEAVESGGMQEDGVRQRPVAGRFPAVDERDAGARLPSRAGMNQAGSSSSPERTVVASYGMPSRPASNSGGCGRG